MSEEQATQQIILDTAQRIFSDHCDKALLDRAEQGEFPEPLWEQIAQNGFNQLGAQGSGTTAQDMFAFVLQCGRFAVPMPMAETLLVNRWLTPGEGVYSIGCVVGDEIVGVPWGRNADRVVGVQRDSDDVVVVDDPKLTGQDTNMAGEPRDRVAIPADAVRVTLDLDPYTQLAVTRINLVAGSLLKMLELGIQYATERVQFGRAISKFQVIQHNLAVVAAEAAAARRAADAAADAMGTDRFVFEVAASKARVGEAATLVAEQIHQVHGAMGFTHEHQLHHYSRRAWAWRDEYGNEFEWQALLGSHLASLGADQVWPFIATRS